MNKIYTILFIIFLLILSGCNSDNTVISIKPNQKIKSVTEWLVDGKTEAKISKISIKTYDIYGNVVQDIEYSDKGSLQSQTNISYDNQQSKEVTQFFDQTGKVDSIIQNAYVLDTKGNITEQVIVNNLGDTLNKTMFNYDSFGNLIKKTELNSNGLTVSVTNYSYVYNTDGKIVVRIINPKLDGSFLSKDSLIYRVDQQKIDMVNYNSSGKVDVVYTYNYNTYGNIVREIQAKLDGSIIKKIIYEYTYY